MGWGGLVFFDRQPPFYWRTRAPGPTGGARGRKKKKSTKKFEQPARPPAKKNPTGPFPILAPRRTSPLKNGGSRLVCPANPIPGDPLGWTGATWYSDANYPANAACGRPFFGEQASSHSAAAIIDTSGPSGYESLPAVRIVHDSHGADGLAMYGYNDINYTSSTVYYVDFFLKCGRAGTQLIVALYNYWGWSSARTVTCTGSWQYVSASRGTGGFSGKRTFAYDLANRLKSTTEGGSTTTYSYDGDGVRLQAAGGQTTNFVWDTNNALPQLALERDGAGATLRNYLRGVDLVSMETSGQSAYFHRDALGSIINVTSDTGATQLRLPRVP